MIERVTGQRLIRMELKYCEGCGGLLLRPAGKQVIYCATCNKKLAELPLKIANQDGVAPVSDETPENESACSASAGCHSVCDPVDRPRFEPRSAASSNDTHQRRLA